VEMHNYGPRSPVFFGFEPCLSIDKRWVVKPVDNVAISNSTIKFHLEDLDTQLDPERLVVCKRDNEISGLVTKLNTYYNSTANTISADFFGFGEYFIVADKISSPSLYEPVNNSKGLPIAVTMKWNPINDATGYAIQVSATQDFSTFIIDSENLVNTELTIGNLVNSRTYYWRVKGYQEDCDGNWSETWSFKTKLPPPKLANPFNSTYNIPVSSSLSWFSVPETEFYTIEVSLSSDFSTLVDSRNVFNDKNYKE